MNRRDFLKSLGAVGLFVALPRFVDAAEIVERGPAVPSIPVPLMGSIYRVDCSAFAHEHKHAEMRLLRGEKNLLHLPVSTWGGLCTWRCQPQTPIIYDRDMHFYVDEHIRAHTVVYPLNGDSPMYWGAEWQDGKTVETWIPLRKA